MINYLYYSNYNSLAYREGLTAVRGYRPKDPDLILYCTSRMGRGYHGVN